MCLQVVRSLISTKQSCSIVRMAVHFGNLASVKAVYTIKKRWTDLIKANVKTMELKVQKRMYQGDSQSTVALAECQTGLIWGEAFIDDMVEIPFEDLFAKENFSQHRVTPAAWAEHFGDKMYDKVFGLKLVNVVHYPKPLPFRHKPGAVGKNVLSGDKAFLTARTGILNLPHSAAIGAMPKQMPQPAPKRKRWAVGALQPFVQYHGQSDMYPCGLCGAALPTNSFFWDPPHNLKCSGAIRTCTYCAFRCSNSICAEMQGVCGCGHLMDPP